MHAMDDYFRGKKITIMGLGLLGRGVGDAEFLASAGAELIITDLKNEEELAPSLKYLKKFDNISYTFGKHDLKDFEHRDLILKAAGVPLDSPYIAHARKQNIPIEMSAALCARLSLRLGSGQGGAIVIGITGTRGKSTTTHLIHHILKLAGKHVHLGGNVRGVSTLALLSHLQPGDFLVLELDSWQLQGFGEQAMSPHIAVFTNFLSDHMNYYKGDEERYFEDKANIFKFQERGDYLVAGEEASHLIKQKYGGKLKGTLIIPTSLPKQWKFKLVGEHNRVNAALAVEVAKMCTISEKTIRKALESFKSVAGRLELVRTLCGVHFYNDTTATTPDATLAALRALAKRRKVILIMGGADKSLDMTPLLRELPRACKTILLLAGTGTEKIKNAIIGKKAEFDSLQSALAGARATAKKGDIVLFSPAFASFGMFKNEFDRGDQFVEAVKRMK